MQEPPYPAVLFYTLQFYIVVTICPLVLCTLPSSNTGVYYEDGNMDYHSIAADSCVRSK